MLLSIKGIPFTKALNLFSVTVSDCVSYIYRVFNCFAFILITITFSTS